MAHSTDLYCCIEFNRKTYNYKSEVESDLEDINESISRCEKRLRDLALMTEPSKFAGKEEDPYYFVTNTLEDNLELLQEYIIERYKLEMLLEKWDTCHNEKGLAIDPPDDMHYDSAFLRGDYVYSIKKPSNKIQ